MRGGITVVGGVASLAAALACGCGGPFAIDRSTGASTSDATDADTLSSTTLGSTTQQGAPDLGPGGDFLTPPDLAADASCSPWEQDCAIGHKCTFYDGQGNGTWNATTCVPVAPHPDPVGAPCTVAHSPTSGLDSCERGAMCWHVDPDTGLGRCEALCRGTASDPVCVDPGSHCTLGFFSLCLPTCDPLAQDCPEGEGCYPIDDVFACAVDVSGAMGSFGNPCERSEQCNPGKFCADAALLPGCNGTRGCCTGFCRTDAFTCSQLDPALSCVPWFEPGHAPPGLERVGGCMLAP